MSRYYKTVKRYYDKGWYTDEDVAVFVRTGKITEEEYNEAKKHLLELL